MLAPKLCPDQPQAVNQAGTIAGRFPRFQEKYEFASSFLDEPVAGSRYFKACIYIVEGARGF